MGSKFTSKDVSNISRIQGTNDNSILSKCSMIKYGYFKDDFLPHMIGKFSRRAPLINRGYYIRAKAIEYILLNFIDYYNSKPFQIISLGAGFDTSFFRLTKQGKLENCTFIEIDYFDVAQRKANLMQQEPNLWNCLKSPEKVPLQKDSYIMIDAANYKLMGIDLTKLDIFDACIRASGVSYELPTLFLSECVITYISTKKSANLLRFIAKSFAENCFVLYEQIHPDDSFGRFMCQHFKQLGSSLRGISTFKDEQDQVKRFLDAGWDYASGCDMSQFYYNIVSGHEKCRIENLEVFDEYEEWLLKCNHYMVLVACKGMKWDAGISMHRRGPHMPADNGRPLSMCVHQYCTDDTEIFEHGGVKAHYVKAELIQVSGDEHGPRECLLRASGYGQNPLSSGHCRLSCVSILDLVSNVLTHIEPVRSELLVNSLCGSMTKISSNDFLFFGGRSSPLKPNNVTTRLHLQFNDSSRSWEAECSELATVDCSQMPSPRWRHIAGVYWIHDRSHFLVYGGRNSNPLPLADTYTLDLTGHCWKQQLQTTSSPGPLCSASVVSVGTEAGCDNKSRDACCGCCCLLVFGGLAGPDLMPCADLWRWCGRNETWTKVTCDGAPMARFSHTAHLVHRSSRCNARCVKLLSLGGVSHEVPYCGLALISIDLSNNTAHSVDIGLDTTNTESECVMIHNHGSAFSQLRSTAWIVGGGGNCFSFGTQLNEHIYSIEMDREEFYK